MLQSLFNRGDGDIGGWVGLVAGVDNNTVLDNDGPSITPVDTFADLQLVAQVSDQLGTGVGGELDVLGVLHTQVLGPGLVGEWVVNGDNDNLVNALGFQVAQLGDVAWDVADGTSWGESSWGTSDDDSLVLGQEVGPGSGAWHSTGIVGHRLIEINVLELDVLDIELFVNLRSSHCNFFCLVYLVCSCCSSIQLYINCE